MIKELTPDLEAACRSFLDGHAAADYSHDPAWLAVIRETYGKEAGALVVVETLAGDPASPAAVKGVAPYAWLGRKLVSLPYLDYGGPAAETPALAESLWKALAAKAAERGATLDIRSREPLPGLVRPQNEKVGMILPLKDGDHDAYWKSLDAKVRNQVRKAEKSAVSVRWGREDRLDDFYSVFCVNMRDLGSPVHDIRIFRNVLKGFPGAGIGTAHREGRCIGGLFRILWRDSLVIPWASTLRDERVHSPNNALYWESIRFAFERKCSLVDFGRSSKDEGTYKFKKQWLAEERPLCWYPFDAKGHPMGAVTHAASGKLKWAQGVWSRLPLGLANALGPRVRGRISA